MDINNENINNNDNDNNSENDNDETERPSLNLDTLFSEYINTIVNVQQETPDQESNEIQPEAALPRIMITEAELPIFRDPVSRLVNQFAMQSNAAPLFNNRNILFESLNEKPMYKKVLSEEGHKQLKKIKFSESSKANNTCPIFQITFDEDDEIIELPCSHCFTPDGISKWLSEEKAVCPVCRFQLDCKEIKDEPINTQETLSPPPQPQPQPHPLFRPNPISASHDGLLRSLFSLANNPNIFRNSRITMLDQEEEDDLQAAILASLQDSNNN